MVDDQKSRLLALEKIKKLIRLENGAKSLGSYGEATAAAKGIHRLLTMYNLKLSEIHMDDDSSSKLNIIQSDYMDYTDPYGEWKRRVLAVVCQHNYCQAMIVPSKHLNFIIGEAENVVAVECLFHKLVKYFTEMADTRGELSYWFQLKSDADKQLYYQSYYDGAVDGLIKLYEEVQPTKEERSLTVCHTNAIDEYLRGMGYDTDRVATPAKTPDRIKSAYYSVGVEDGFTAPLHEHVGYKR